MKEMPKYIKNKIRRYAEAQAKACTIYESLCDDFDKYEVPIDNLTACSDDFEHTTEALAFINNVEISDLEDSIKSIEEVFLYFANKKIER